MVRDTPPSQDASTHKIWSSYLKEYRRYALDTKGYRRTDIVIIIKTKSEVKVPLCVRCISPIFFEVGIPNLVCGCILGWQSVVYHFRVTVILTLTSDLVFIVITMSDLVFRIIVSGAYLLYNLR